MSGVVPGVVVFATFLLVGTFAFFNVDDMWTGAAESLQKAAERRTERVETLVSINSAKQGEPHCANFTVEVDNPGQTSVADFSEMDFVAEYTGRDATNQATHLQYVSSIPAANQWTLSSITPDTLNPNTWDPEEKATFSFKLAPAMDAATPGSLTIGTPLAVTDSTYLNCDLTFFLHSETTAIDSVNYYQLRNVFPDGTAATITSTFTPGWTGRVRPASNSGKFVFPLAGFTNLSAGTWTLTYRVKRNPIDSGFVWFTNAQDISLTATDAWTDIVLTPSMVPAGATSAVVEVVNTDVTAHRGMVRGKEDTRDYMAGASDGTIQKENHRWQVVKLDAGGVIQGYITDTSVLFKLLGYTKDLDPAYFTTPPEFNPTTTKDWTQVDVADDVDADADGVILLLRSIDGKDKKYAIREVGSSYNTTGFKLGKNANTMYLVGLDVNKQFEAWIENTNIKIYLVGQTKGSVVFYDDDKAVADPTFNSWVQLDADTYAVDDVADGLIFLLETTAIKSIGLRHGDSGDDWKKWVEKNHHIQGAAGINAANQWYTFIEDTEVDTFIAAYTRPVGIDVHADIDVLVRKADGVIRATLATNVANSVKLTGSDWQTLTATYTFATYTVVDQTDYLEIDLFAEATNNIAGVSTTVDFRIDDPVLASADQTRIDF